MLGIHLLAELRSILVGMPPQLSLLMFLALTFTHYSSQRRIVRKSGDSIILQKKIERPPCLPLPNSLDPIIEESPREWVD